MTWACLKVSGIAYTPALSGRCGYATATRDHVSAVLGAEKVRDLSSDGEISARRRIVSIWGQRGGPKMI
ncbi:MAG: hypothetical protein QOC62_4923 [Mycobacterium sp.]|jgi:hypothetical protein|nr:hypothetical protein [Mycobacterium sp.]